MGHREGAHKAGEIARYCSEKGVGILTLFAFSTENWSRPKQEVDEIMSLLRRYLDDVSKKMDKNIKLKILGDRSKLSDDLQAKIKDAQEKSKDNDGMLLNIALNYGGRQEIVNAARQIARLVKLGEIKSEQIDEELFSKMLYTAGLPDPDIILRPSGEMRLSNFLLWQCAYAELIYMDVLWPDFTADDLDNAVIEYMGRKRRFGGV